MKHEGAIISFIDVSDEPGRVMRLHPKVLLPTHKHFAIGFTVVLLLLSFGCLQAHAQIDFSVLEKYRGYKGEPRPERERSREEAPKRKSETEKPMSNAEQKLWKDKQKRVAEEKQKTRGELLRLSRAFQMNRAGPSTELTPHSDLSFGIIPDNGMRPFGSIMATSLGGIATPASRIPSENLRRAAAILEAFKPKTIGSMSEEDMTYLADQAAQAMEGAPLSVQIIYLPERREDDTRRIVQQAQDIEAARAVAASATSERQRVEEQLVKVQQNLQAGTGDSEALKNQREKLLLSYKAAYNAETRAKDRYKDMTGKVTTVWH
jgi:hypothetical protein